MTDAIYVSIIIPVYNASETLQVCLDSLEAQDYPYIEMIFVNDASVDASLAVLNEFAAKNIHNSFWKIRVESHSKNRGVAAARNTGLSFASGKYIYFTDADDKLDAHAISSLVGEAERKGLDILGFDWYLSFEQNERKMNQPEISEPMQAITYMLDGRMRWNLWIFLIKRSLFVDHHLQFVEGKNMGEDLLMMIKLFSNSKKVGKLSHAFYHYRQSNTSSLTKVYSDKHIEEVSYHVFQVESYLKSKMKINNLEELIAFLKLQIKLPLLISSRKSQYKKWGGWFSEANSYVMQNSNCSMRIRLLQLAAFRGQFWIIKLHYYLVIKFIYGIIYK